MKILDLNITHIIDSVQHFIVSDQFVELTIIAAICVAIFFITLKYIEPILVRVVSAREKKWAPVIKKQKSFRQLAYLLPVLFLIAISPYDQGAVQTNIVHTLVAINVTLLLGAFVRTASKIYELYPISKEKPIKSYAQLLTIVIYVLGAIIIGCQATDTDATGFLVGASAVMAAILLVFRDTILSFIASMQIAANNLIRKGDWVEVPTFGADGDVVDIALHVIRVQNFDNTIVTIPTYKIMETGFKNWRGMFESGARQIKKSILIDQNSIHFMDDADLKQLYSHPMVKNFLPPLKELQQQHNENNPKALTNLGILRTYLVNYLKKHQQINKDMTILVRVLEPTPTGVPLQIYAYTNDTRWFHHEHIKGDIIEHVIALLRVFGLRVFQNIMDTDLEASSPLRKKK